MAKNQHNDADTKGVQQKTTQEDDNMNEKNIILQI